MSIDINTSELAMINRLLKREGFDFFTNDPKDSGGPTRWGITQTTLEAAYKRLPRIVVTGQFPKSVKDLTQSQATTIYNLMYWKLPGFKMVADLDPLLAELLFDYGVVSGPITASRILQRVLNVMNDGGKHYPDLVVDGQIGQLTLDALEDYQQVRGIAGNTVLRNTVASMMSARLVELAEARPKDERFQYGWQAKRAVSLLFKLIGVTKNEA